MRHLNVCLCIFLLEPPLPCFTFQPWGLSVPQLASYLLPLPALPDGGNFSWLTGSDNYKLVSARIWKAGGRSWWGLRSGKPYHSRGQYGRTKGAEAVAYHSGHPRKDLKYENTSLSDLVTDSVLSLWIPATYPLVPFIPLPFLSFPGFEFV